MDWHLALRRLSLRCLVASSVMLIGASSTAWASTPSDVSGLYDAGKLALDEGDIPRALMHFKSALKKAEGDEGMTWQLLLAVAVAYRASDQPAHAVEYFRRFLSQTESFKRSMPVKWAKRRVRAERDLGILEAEVEKSHGAVSVMSTPEGAAVYLGEEQAGADGDVVSPFSFWLRPGSYEVNVRMEGYGSQRKQIEVKAGGNHPVMFSLKPAAPSSSAPVSARDSNPAPSIALGANDLVQDRTGPFILLGSAGAAALVGVVFTALASREADALNAQEQSPTTGATREDASAWDASYDTLASYEALMWVGYGVAGAAALSGAIWLALQGAEDAEDTGGLRPTMRIMPSPSGLSGSATWRF